MKHATWPRISGDVMIAVRRAVTEVLVNHDAEARVEVRVRLQPMPRRHRPDVCVDVEDDETTDPGLEIGRVAEQPDDDQLKASQEARFRALEL